MAKDQNCILTFTGKLIDPLRLKPEDIAVEDIAHSLAMQTRANGHFKDFYSVAQHSVNCALEAENRGLSRRVRLLCLLHDASEAYIADIPRPVKCRLQGFAEIEEKVSAVIYGAFGLKDYTEEEIRYVGEIDDAMLYHEFLSLTGERVFEKAPYISMRHDFSVREIKDVYRDFLRIFYGSETVNTVKVVGVDGCPAGWAAFVLEDGRYDFRVYRFIDELCDEHKDAACILVDMPVGLPETAKDIRPDAAARKILKGKSSSIFNCPCRQAVYAGSYEQANLLNREVLGAGLPKQSYMLASKIREIDLFLRKNASWRERLLESHPELAFAVLNGCPVMEKKREAAGVEKRLAVLSGYYPEVREAYSEACARKNGANPDDILDAICLAVTARLALNGGMRTVPETPLKDACGLPMRMVICNV